MVLFVVTRYGFKMMLDQMLLGEFSTPDDVQECLEEYDRDWYIGLEKDEEWKAAVLSSRPSLFSLGHNNTQVHVIIKTHFIVPTILW